MKTTKILTALLILSVLANGFLTALIQDKSKETNLLRKEKKAMIVRAQSLPEDQSYYSSQQIDFVLFNSSEPEPENVIFFEWEGDVLNIPTEPGAKIQISGINENVIYLNAIDE